MHHSLGMGNRPRTIDESVVDFARRGQRRVLGVALLARLASDPPVEGAVRARHTHHLEQAKGEVNGTQGSESWRGRELWIQQTPNARSKAMRASTQRVNGMSGM